jgi:hypothetical protein
VRLFSNAGLKDCRLVSGNIGLLGIYMRCRLFACLVALLQPAVWALSLDDTREQAIAELGKPGSIATRGAREILLYPNNIRLELENGKVVSAEGINLGETTPAVVEISPPAQPKQPAAPADPEEDELAMADDSLADREHVSVTGHSQAGLEKSFDALVASRDQAAMAPLRPTFNLVEFVVKVVLIFLMTIAALRLACKYWGAEVFWSGIATIAAVDAVVRGSLTLAGELLLELPTLFYLDEAIAAIVMVLLLKKLSVNQSTAQAVELTMTTKVFTVIVGGFLVTVLLNSLL